MTDTIFDSLQSHGLLPSWAQDERNEQDVREAIQVALEGMVDEITNMS